MQKNAKHITFDKYNEQMNPLIILIIVSILYNIRVILYGRSDLKDRNYLF